MQTEGPIRVFGNMGSWAKTYWELGNITQNLLETLEHFALFGNKVAPTTCQYTFWEQGASKYILQYTLFLHKHERLSRPTLSFSQGKKI